MKKKYFAFFLLLLFVKKNTQAANWINLSGEQDGYYEQAEYLVSSTIEVKEGKTLEFAPGSIIRFKEYCGIVVRGTLKCYGSAIFPVVFTSERDQSGRGGQTPARPFDWIGIRVEHGGAIELNYTRISFGTQAIDLVSPSSSAKLEAVVFVDNGRGNISIAGKPIMVEDNIPWTSIYPAPAEKPKTDVSVPNNIVKDSVELVSQPISTPSLAKRRGFQLSLGALTLCGSAVAITGYVQADKYARLYYRMDDLPPTSEVQAKEKSMITADYRKKTKFYETIQWSGLGLAIAGAAAFSVSWIF